MDKSDIFGLIVGMVFGALWAVIFLGLLIFAVEIDPVTDAWPGLRVPVAGIVSLIITSLIWRILVGPADDE